jgi:MFS family permease
VSRGNPLSLNEEHQVDLNEGPQVKREKMKRNTKLIIATSLMGWTLVNIDGTFFTFSYPMIQKDLGLTETQISYIYTFINIIGALSVLFFGPVMDRIGRKFVFQLSLIATALGSLFSGFSWNFLSLAGFRGLTQLGATTEYIAGSTMVIEESPNHSRGFWAGFALSGYPLAWFIASLVSMLVIPTLGWRWLFVLGVVPMFFVLWSRKFVKEGDRFQDLSRVRQNIQDNENVDSVYKVNTAKVNSFEYKQLFEPELIRTTIINMLWGFIINFGYSGIWSWLPSIFSRHNLPLTSVFSSSAVATGFAVLGYISSAYLGEKLGRREVSLIYFILGSIFGALLAFKGDSWGTITIFYTLWYFFAVGGYGAVIGFVLESFPTRVRGTGGSIFSVATWLSFIVAGFIGPIFLNHFGVNNSVFIWGSICPFVSGLLLLCLKRVKPGVDLEDISI